MRRNSKNLATVLVAAVCAAWLAGCSREEEKREVAVPPAIIFSLPEPGESPFRSFPGEVTSEENLRLSFEVSGRLVEFPVYDGKVVEEGSLIGSLDQADFRAAFDSAQARFTAAQQEFERAETLRRRNVISQSELDQRREALDVTSAELRTAQRALSDTRLTAPIKGRVARRFVRNHQNISAREPVALLQNLQTLDIEVQVPETLMALITSNSTAAQTGQLVEANAEFAAVPGERFALELRSFSTQANPSSRTFPVTFVLHPPADRNILPGMTCTVNMRFRNTGGTPALQEGLFQIPVRAIVTAEGKPWVWRWDSSSGKVSRAQIEMVSLSGEFAEVRSGGLKAGDEIVASGVRFLSEGDAVRRMETRNP